MIRGRITVGALAVAIGATSAWAQETVKVDDRPTHSFAKELINGQGVRSLADLQGRPVLVEYWGWH